MMTTDPQTQTVDQFKESCKALQFYARRGLHDDFPIGGVTFRLEPLPTSAVFALAELPEAREIFETVRLGVKGWKGLRDAGDTLVDVPYESEPWSGGYGGDVLQAVAIRLMDRIPPQAIRLLYLRLQQLSVLSHTEKDAVTFTAPPSDSAATGPAASNPAADAQTQTDPVQ